MNELFIFHFTFSFSIVHRIYIYRYIDIYGCATVYIQIKYHYTQQTLLMLHSVQY